MQGLGFVAYPEYILVIQVSGETSIEIQLPAGSNVVKVYAGEERSVLAVHLAFHYTVAVGFDFRHVMHRVCFLEKVVRLFVTLYTGKRRLPKNGSLPNLT